MSEPLQQSSHVESSVALEERYSTGTYRKRALSITHGEGVWVYDEGGKRYFDGIAGIGANVLGHCHERFTSALEEQLRKTISVPELLCSDIRAQYQEALLSLFPSCYSRVFLCNGGSEANEAALKFAQLLSEREGFVSLNFGYHGKTLGSLSVTHNPKYREPFSTIDTPIQFLPTGNVERMEEILSREGNIPAAFIFEAIQGEGGVRSHGEVFLQAVASRVQPQGGYLIADEVQCGFGRTGRWWGFDEYGVEPDFIVLGKGIGNGVPLAAVVLHGRVPEIPLLSHTTTYGGNPLSCRAGLAVIESIREESLLENVQARGQQFRQALLDANMPRIREIRGRGMMIGVELKGRAGQYLAPLQERGVLALLAGSRVLRLLPPYVTSEEEMSFVIEAFIDVLGR